MSNWIRVNKQAPPQNEIVYTKIDIDGTVRNEQKLKLQGTLWWLSDGSMYVYYAPTHWKSIKHTPEEKAVWDNEMDN